MNISKIPKKIGRYQVIKELGRGGMGMVFLAHDPFIDRSVAIKVASALPVSGADKREKYQKVFFNEARAAGKLAHPHIVSVYDAMVEDDQYNLVMEYMDGPTLMDEISANPLMPIEKVVTIIYQCARALDYAHQKEIIHRDIKPSNILLSKKGEAKISDFGIALAKGAEGSGESNELTGSVYYASPEQINNEPLTQQSDIFSLGVVMYEILTGVKPFSGDNDVATVYKITHSDPPPLSKYRSDIPGSLESIVYRALQKDVEKRYSSGLDIAFDLSAAFDNLRLLNDQIKSKEKFNALKKIQFFKDFESNELDEVLRDTQWLEYEPNSTIIKQDEIDNCFYIIVSGEAVVKKEGKSVATLKAGDCFGEMAYLGHMKRTATIQASSKTILMKINSVVIEKTSMATQLRFYKVFSNTLINRLSYTTKLLSQFPF